MSLLNCLESVIMWWSTDITQFLIATIFPYCIVDSRAFIWSRFITSRLLFLLSCFTYSLPQNPLKVKEILLIFSATPGSFICRTINRRRDHSIKVHCYTKYVRNLKKKKRDFAILPYNAASMDKETYTEKCNHSFDDRYIPWISIFQFLYFKNKWVLMLNFKELLCTTITTNLTFFLAEQPS